MIRLHAKSYSINVSIIIAMSNPTRVFTTLELQNMWIEEFYVVQERPAPDSKAPKL